jgi:hypothetical protein
MGCPCGLRILISPHRHQCQVVQTPSTPPPPPSAGASRQLMIPSLPQRQPPTQAAGRRLCTMLHCAVQVLPRPAAAPDLARLSTPQARRPSPPPNTYANLPADATRRHAPTRPCRRRPPASLQTLPPAPVPDTPAGTSAEAYTDAAPRRLHALKVMHSVSDAASRHRPRRHF